MSGVGATRADVWGALAIMAISAALAFGPSLWRRLSAHATPAECEALIERYVQLKAKAITDKPDAKKRAAEVDRAKSAAGPHFVKCAGNVTRSELECAQGAHNADEVERCIQ
ncbi:MAG: hypothetical protein IPK82_09015 [Polyangiaceae bacterium]|nr:hypothetical protein [Polyangiaceae bacterium]